MLRAQEYEGDGVAGKEGGHRFGSNRSVGIDVCTRNGSSTEVTGRVQKPDGNATCTGFQEQVKFIKMVSINIETSSEHTNKNKNVLFMLRRGGKIVIKFTPFPPAPLRVFFSRR